MKIADVRGLAKLDLEGGSVLGEDRLRLERNQVRAKVKLLPALHRSCQAFRKFRPVLCSVGPGELGKDGRARPDHSVGIIGGADMLSPQIHLKAQYMTPLFLGKRS